MNRPLDSIFNGMYEPNAVKDTSRGRVENNGNPYGFVYISEDVQIRAFLVNHGKNLTEIKFCKFRNGVKIDDIIESQHINKVMTAINYLLHGTAEKPKD